MTHGFHQLIGSEEFLLFSSDYPHFDADDPSARFPSASDTEEPMAVPDTSVRDVPDVEGVDPDHPMVEIFRLTDQSPVMWHENKIGSTNHPWCSTT